MVRFTGGLLLFTALSAAAPPEHVKVQQVLGSPVKDQAGNPRKLQGKFLHITDVHPDPFYKPGTDPHGGHPCHAGKGKVDAGYYGAPTTECDTPFTLVNATFKWIEENLKDEIDFVVWTGDSARHDNDLDIPRSTKQIQNLNRFLVDKFVETFGKTDNINDTDPTNDFVIPIIPTFGNNDILPHNILEPGPNRWTKAYTKIWKKFVPEEQYHTFEKGGWFFTEVIPNRLAVFSLNTLYFFENNSAVDGCDAHSEPGYEHMEWLRIQLQFLRTRGMKAILIGHVPPARTDAKRNWEESCYQKYTLWLRQYRDVVVGSLYGHMNIDHFMFQDVWDLTYKFNIEGIDDEDLRPNEYDHDPTPDTKFSAEAKITYLIDLRATWSDLPAPPKGISYVSAMSPDSASVIAEQKNNKEKEKFLKDIGGRWAERFSLSLVSPSVVPNYFPTLRIINYNITGLEQDYPAIGPPQGKPASIEDILDEAEPDVDQDQESEPDQDDSLSTSKKKKKKNKKKKHKKKKHKTPKPDFPVPKPPSSTSPPGPAHSPQTFSFLSWTQLYANLTKINENIKIHTSKPRLTSKDSSEIDTEVKKHFSYQVEYTTNNDSAYRIPDMTVRSWLHIAEKIGRAKYKGSQSNEVGSLNDEEISRRRDETAFEERDEEILTPRELLPREEEEEGEEGEGGGDLSDQEIDSTKHKGKGKHKRRGKLSANRLWHVFVRRAYVNAKNDTELEEEFGRRGR